MLVATRHCSLPQARARLCPSRCTPLARVSLLRRLLSSLAVLEQRDGKLNVSSLAAVSAAQKLGGSITGFIAGKNGKTVAEEAAKVQGLEKVLYVENEAYDKVGVLFS